ncbi:hypothetical protein J6590_014975 [Homalodisca vitripennis]|nr:hypothetical protein J6590_014975 [Homalodisca vitripennis]
MLSVEMFCKTGSPTSKPRSKSDVGPHVSRRKPVLTQYSQPPAVVVKVLGFRLSGQSVDHFRLNLTHQSVIYRAPFDRKSCGNTQLRAFLSPNASGIEQNPLVALKPTNSAVDAWTLVIAEKS